MPCGPRQKVPSVPRLSRALHPALMTVQLGLESVSTFPRNRCPACPGISVHLRLESVSSLPRNPHSAETHLSRIFSNCSVSTIFLLALEFKDSRCFLWFSDFGDNVSDENVYGLICAIFFNANCGALIAGVVVCHFCNASIYINGYHGYNGIFRAYCFIKYFDFYG